MRIAFVSQSFDSVAPAALNSVGLVTHHLATELARDHEVVVYASLGCAGNAGDWEGADGVTYRLMPASVTDQLVARSWPYVAPAIGVLRGGLRPPLSTSSAAVRNYRAAVASDLAGEDFDVIHVQHATQLLPDIREVAPNAVVVLHAHAHWFPQTPASRLTRRLAAADLVVACSDFVRDQAVRHVPALAGRCVTVHNGVDADALDRRRADHEAGLAARPCDDPFVLSLGAVSPHKGVHDLLDAFAVVARDRPTLQLRVVGPEGAYPMEEAIPLDDPEAVRSMRELYRGDYSARLHQSVPNELRSCVSFCGRIPRTEVLDHLLGAELLAFPSIWDEGFGLPALEALAAGTAVVATRSGGVPEFVRDGQTGLTVAKGDTAALAEAMSTLLDDDDLRHRFGAAGREVAREQFAWPVVADRLLDAYSSVGSHR